MAKHPLDPAFAKVRRAEAHIRDLKAAIRAFLNTRPYRLVPQLNEKVTEAVWNFDVDPIPEEIECIAADALHNLRTPLDKMLAAAFRSPGLHRDKASIQKLKFPAAEGAKNLADLLAGQEEHLTKPVIDFLRETEPYPGGAGKAFWTINQLDNRDKHRALLEPIKLSFSTAHFRQVAVHKGYLLRLGSKRGKHLVPVPDARQGAWDMHQPEQTLCPTLRLEPLTVADYYLEFTAPYDDMEVLTTTPGAQVHANVKPNLSLAFSDSRSFEGVPVVNALETMRESVLTLIENFGKRFIP